MDAKEALQYVYCVCLVADQGKGVGKEQVENAWMLVRRIIVAANNGAAWEELVGGFRPDGTRFVCHRSFIWILWNILIILQSGVIEQGATLLQLQDSKQFHEQIIVQAAKQCEENDRISEAIKLYNLAGDYLTVVSCLAQALGNTVAQPSGEGEKGRAIERTAADILRHYERMNRAVGKDRDAVVQLLRIRDAVDAKNSGRPEVALDVGVAHTMLTLSDCKLCFRSWNPQISSLSTATSRKSHAVLKTLKICMNPYSETYRYTSHSPWTLWQKSTKK
jgi:nuclear pore complex protein Nup93